MAAKEYRTINGFIQFDPDIREIESLNLEVVDFTVRAAGSEGTLVRVTVFPEFEEYYDIFERGDAVMIDGPFEVRLDQNKEGEKVQYVNLRASRIQHNGELLAPKEREVVKRGAKTKSKF